LKSTETAKEKPPIVDQISAGGVAFKNAEDRFELAIVSVNPSGRWQLPKGIIDAGETPEVAAMRELREEAGLETEVVDLIEKIEYWYVGSEKGRQVRFHKFVYFYLLRYVRGEVSDHDHEILEARWVAPDEAILRLSFKSEKQVVAKAIAMLGDRS
jgi:8-oxo-dGTP diphosphatase